MHTSRKINEKLLRYDIYSFLVHLHVIFTLANFMISYIYYCLFELWVDDTTNIKYGCYHYIRLFEGVLNTCRKCNPVLRNIFKKESF